MRAVQEVSVLSGSIKRREARELAFQLIFERTFHDIEIEDLLELALQARDIEPDEYVISALRGIEEHQSEIDGIIEKFSRARAISRLSHVVLAVLRLAIYEIKFVANIDAPISINEAVELTKIYGGKDESGFVNGVLGNYVRSLDESGEAAQ